MLFALDSSDPKEIKEILEIGYPMSKITTNPTMMAMAMERIQQEEGKKLSVYGLWDMILEMTRCPVSGEALGTSDYDPGHVSPDIFVKEAEAIASHDKRMVVKLPAIEPALKASRILRGSVPTNFTLIFSLHQAMVAADHNADYVSPFVGRIDDKLGRKNIGMILTRDIAESYRGSMIPTKILTASIRHLSHIELAAKYNSDMVTVPYRVLVDLFNQMGKNAVDLIHKLEKDYPSFKRQKPLRSTYSQNLERLKMKEWEKQLLEDGVVRFLKDAQSVNYTVL